MRNQCQAPVSCRKCRVSYERDVKHSYLEEHLIYAQCGGKRSCLNSSCPIVKPYKIGLKMAVDNVLTTGSIKGAASGEVFKPFHR